MNQPRVLSADTLAGTDVKNPDGEKLGNIKSIMLDVEHGRVAYAVLSFGGFLGMGDKLFALPWSSLRSDPTDKTLVLSATKEQLESAEGFDKNKWPQFSDPAFMTKTYKHYGQTPYWN